MVHIHVYYCNTGIVMSIPLWYLVALPWYSSTYVHVYVQIYHYLKYTRVRF
jgi:hypothetical protein